MNLEKTIKNINRSLNKKQPTSFNSVWIKYRCKVSYKFVIENIRNELGEPDWDEVVRHLDHNNQKLWFKGVKVKNKIEPYEDKIELEKILSKYKDKLYTFLSQADKSDKQVCDLICIRLVRTAQKGNLLAREKAVIFLNYLIDQWMENDINICPFRGYSELIQENIDRCIRRYRYTGSFISYLHRTFEYAGRGIKPLVAFSLDENSLITEKSKIESVVKDSKTGEIIIYHKRH